jgi:hypothetical protein
MLRSLRNDFCNFVVLCIPLGTSFELLPVFPFSLHSMVHAQLLHLQFLGDFALIRLKRRLHDGPIKNLSPPLERKRVPWKGKNIKNYIKLYIVSPKFICIPRSWNFVTIHVLQSVGTRP